MKTNLRYDGARDVKMGGNYAEKNAPSLKRKFAVNPARTDRNSSQKYDVQSLTRDRYLETFEVLQSLSREYQDIAGFVVTEIENKIGSSFSLLDVGAGSGYMLAKLGERLSVSNIKKYVAVEPDPVAAAALIQMLSRFSQVPSVVEIERFNQALATDLQQSFDVVLFCHSLYGIKDPIEALLSAKNLLTKNGMLIAIINTPEGFTRLFSEFDFSLNRDRPAIENFDLKSNKVAAGLRASNCDFSLLPISTYFDVSSLFDGSAGAEARRLEFLSFGLQCELANAPRQLLEEVEFRLRSSCLTKDGKLILPQPTAAFVIS
jgi:SAM-dependent methyltransferase